MAPAKTPTVDEALDSQSALIYSPEAPLAGSSVQKDRHRRPIRHKLEKTIARYGPVYLPVSIRTTRKFSFTCMVTITM